MFSLPQPGSQERARSFFLFPGSGWGWEETGNTHWLKSTFWSKLTVLCKPIISDPAGQAMANLKHGEIGPGVNLGVCGVEREDSLSRTRMCPGWGWGLFSAREWGWGMGESCLRDRGKCSRQLQAVLGPLCPHLLPGYFLKLSRAQEICLKGAGMLVFRCLNKLHL